MYKRQVAVCLVRIVAPTVDAAATVGSNADSAIEAVSYTHLDVYKRQALHQADERATDFRYAKRNDGTRSLEGIHYVNTRRFGEKMGEASDLLDGVDNGLRYLLDCKAEWNQILDSF